MSDNEGAFEYHFEQHIDPRYLDRYYRFSDHMRQMASQREGFVSLERQLVEQRSDQYIFRTTMRFKHPQQCMSWLDDPERRRILLQEEEETGFQFKGRANWTGYGRWLSSRIRRPVPTWKVNLMVLLTLYPTAMLLTPILHELFPRAPGATLMLVSNTICVAATSWLLVPAVSRVYRRWLEGDTNTLQTVAALASLVGVFVAMWWGFSHLAFTGGH
jgi:antibiotic biosynthesis monooxygenase (ABM) superfamily enzyme